MADKSIPIRNFNRGGIADSKYAGIPDSVADMVGLDIHSEPGIIKVNQQLDLEDGANAPDELCNAAVNCSDGNQYFFSSESGKIWKLSSGTWSLAHTTTPTNGNAYCYDAIEYQGYIYWVTQNWVHRISVRSTGSFSSNVEEDYFELNYDQEIIGGGDGTLDYTLETSISEAATKEQQFTPREEEIIGIAVYINDKGTGNWTVTIHDAADSSQKTATIANASLTSGAWNYFEFGTVWNPDPNTIYHVHITDTTGDGTVDTLTAADLSDGNIKYLTNSADDFHRMVIQNLTLYITDRQYVHQIYDYRGTVAKSRFALDLPKPYRITDIAIFDTGLVLGTYIDSDTNEARVFTWNTWSTSFSSSDGVEEVGVKAFIPADNHIFAMCGLNGKIYHFNGARLEPAKQIPGDYTPTAYMDMHPNSVATFKGIQIFGLSNGSGNPNSQGVWSYGSSNIYYPKVLNCEFPISKRSGGEFVLTGITMGKILVVGNDLYVCWKDASDAGVDKLDYSTKLDGAYVNTRAVTIDRTMLNNFKKFIASYVECSDDSNVEFYYRKNYNASWTPITDTRKDTERLTITAVEDIKAAPLEFRAVMKRDTGDASVAPILEALHIIVE